MISDIILGVPQLGMSKLFVDWTMSCRTRAPTAYVQNNEIMKHAGDHDHTVHTAKLKNRQIVSIKCKTNLVGDFCARPAKIT